MAEQRQEFTKYEIARIIGARALQVSMDAPLLLKISDEDLKAMRFDALKIAEREFTSGVLPISVKRPMPRKINEKLKAIKDDNVDDEKIAEKEKEIEKQRLDEEKRLKDEQKTAEEARLKAEKEAEQLEKESIKKKKNAVNHIMDKFEEFLR